MQRVRATGPIVVLLGLACSCSPAPPEKKETPPLTAPNSGQGPSPGFKMPDLSGFNKLPPIHVCPARTYQALNPDKLEEVWSSRKRYRLVIGAGKYALDPQADRRFVADTAREVDSALQVVGYSDSLGLLIDEQATRDNVKKAIEQIGSLPSNALVLIYYVGHGVPLDGDLGLGVADRKVDELDALSIRQLLAAALKPFDPQFRKIPRIIFVLESCYAGAAKPFSLSRFVTGDEFKRLAVLTATASGETAELLKGTNRYAFGHLFAKALQADWSCADRTPDGALTALEMRTYAAEQLKDALAQKTLATPMTPGVQDAGLYSTIAYSRTQVADSTGYRREIYDLYVEASPGVTATIAGEEGEAFATCTDKCTIRLDTPQRTVATFAGPGNPVTVKGETLLDLTKHIVRAVDRPAAPVTLGSIQLKVERPQDRDR